LLVTDELRRAVETESSAALVYWLGVNQGTVWRWRLAFGVGQWDTPGSQRLLRVSVERGANVTRGRPLPSEVREKMRQATATEARRQQFEAARAKRWARQNGEDAKGKTMIAPPTDIDSAFDRLHAAGWSIGDVGGPGGWIVHGRRGERTIEAHGETQGKAWAAAVEQAEPLPTVVVEG
jgi:hypothetical protein